MASIAKYQAASGVRWRVQYTDPTKKRRTKTGFKTKKAAEHWCAENIIERNTGSWIDPQKQRATIDSLHPRFIAQKQHLAPSSLKAMDDTWRKYVQPRWGHREVGGITQLEVEEWMSGMAKQASVARRALGILAGTLDIAVKERRIHSNPARGVPLPKKPPQKIVTLTPKQVEALAEECGDNGVIVQTLATTGMRYGELSGLQVRDIDVKAGRAQLQRAVKHIAHKPVIGALKGHEGRSVAIPGHVMEQIAELISGRPATAWVFEGKGGGHLPEVDKHSWFNMAVKRCVDKGTLPYRVTVHDLRHVAAGLLVSAGANVKVIQRQLGHKSASMTLDVYSSLFDSDLDQVSRAMDGLFVGSSNLRQSGR